EAIAASGRDLLAVPQERRIIDFLRMPEQAQRLAVVRAPNPCRPIATIAEQQLLVRRILHPVGSIRMPRDGFAQRTGGYVPDVQLMVAATRDQTLAVRREREAVNGLIGALECSEQLGRGRIP